MTTIQSNLSNIVTTVSRNIRRLSITRRHYKFPIIFAISSWIPRRRWEDNIKMDLQELGCVGMDWIELVQDRDR